MSGLQQAEWRPRRWLPRRLIAIVSSLTLASYFFAMLTALVLLFSTSIGRELLSHEGPVILGAFFFPIETPFRINLFLGFLGLLGIYTLCFYVAAKTKGGFITNVRALFQGPGRFPNWLVAMPLASSGLLLLVIFLTEVESVAGVPTGSLPSLEPYQLLYVLSYSPILEEATFRITTMGSIVSIRILWSVIVARTSPPTRIGRRLALSFLFPDRAKAETGLSCIRNDGLRGVHWSEWTGLIGTSLAFGAAHVLTGSGWDLGKVPTAALSGFALGLVFLVYGAYAPILLHWFFNFYFETISLGSSLLGGVFDIAQGIIVLLTLAVGALGIFAALVWLVSWKPWKRDAPYIGPTGPPQTV